MKKQEYLGGILMSLQEVRNRNKYRSAKEEIYLHHSKIAMELLVF